MTRPWLRAGVLGVLLCGCLDTSSTGQASYAVETTSVVAPQLADGAEARREARTVPAGTGDPAVPSIKVYNGDRSKESLVAWGLRQFDAAGLSLPRVSSVIFLADAARCQGYMGWIQHGPDGPVVTLCFLGDEACVDGDCAEWRLPYKLALLHEFSHAWLSQNLSGEQEEEFMRFEELQSWQDLGVDWFQRGVERAAITMALALSAVSLPMGQEECVKWAQGFRILAGASPPVPCVE